MNYSEFPLFGGGQSTAQSVAGMVTDAKRKIRRTNPVSSKVSYRMSGGLARNHDTKILGALQEESNGLGEGMTSDEIAEAIGFTLVQVARRTSVLCDNGIIYKTGLTRTTRTGRPAMVWKLS